MTVATALASGTPDDRPPNPLPGRQPDPPSDLPPIRLVSPSDLACATPFLLGFHPTQSLVVIAFREPVSGSDQLSREPGAHPRQTFEGVVRLDLPDPAELAADPSLIGQVAQVALDPAKRRSATMVAILGYGPAELVDPFVPAARDLAEQQGMQVKEALRVDAGRWWSYTCRNPRCCPPEGTPFDLATSPVAVACAVEGMTALPSRSELAHRLAPPDGPAERAIAAATDQAVAELLARLDAVPEPERYGAILAQGRLAVHAAIQRYADGGRLDDEEVARLTVLLANVEVRDVAWRAITAEEPHRSLWTDVVRRADPVLSAPPASLLAFTAWRSGDGVLAGLALDRALDADPDYFMAHLVWQGVQSGVSPTVFDEVLTGLDEPGPTTRTSERTPRTAPAGPDAKAGGRFERQLRGLRQQPDGPRPSRRKRPSKSRHAKSSKSGHAKSSKSGRAHRRK